MNSREQFKAWMTTQNKVRLAHGFHAHTGSDASMLMAAWQASREAVEAELAALKTQSDAVMVPRELLLELRDAANECRNVTSRRHQADHFEALTKSADALLGGES